ncbi:sulfurtransferase TusA family protein [Pusillimonas sp. ANT_WB101]|uniref:sulfurtransferase TusA family protein n=1 Tax=Pusillimonas sp. ANT_WB101 TaxID=2597356 RepID=UPI0011ECCB29|nr:sulfurtransferase TusA family protein [Pusillimonas sp. ANT_WB101]KAA0911763.1 sulfurtransferase TusA family protein [Pusillimonas sp. ANT_WB101]
MSDLTTNSSGQAIPAVDLEVDASGLKCPLPILRAKKALAQLQSGQVLKVVTTDTHAIQDFQAFAKQTGNALEAQVEEGLAVSHYLRRR